MHHHEDHARDLLAMSVDADHHDVERLLRDRGWTPAGAGDWALACRSPDGALAARVSPFDPAGPYNAALYAAAAGTGRVPALLAHRRLLGGGDLMIMEWLSPVTFEVAAEMHRAIARRDEALADLVDVIRDVHARALRELIWCGPLDDNPANVMQASDGRLVVLDLFYADGPNLYRAAVDDPDTVVAGIPEHERRFMADIPITSVGGWEPGAQQALRDGIAAAERRAVERRGPDAR